jgi:peptidoglycan/xylan/chitin deacetylase (PgdA/CDA1 family)
MSRRILILNYHHVGLAPPEVVRPKLWVTPALLRLHVRFLQRLGYRFLTVSDALATPDGRLACVTFDDGFRDNLEAGLPVLRQLGVPATFFVVTGEVGRRGVTFPEETGTGAHDMASWDEIRAARDAGWEIGSHAAEHRGLARLPPQEQRRLLLASRDVIRRELGAPPRALAYPYGSYGAETIGIARELGFECGLTTHRGLVRPGDDPFQLVRLTMGGQHALHAVRLQKLLLVHAGLLPLRRPRPRPATPTAPGRGC